MSYCITGIGPCHCQPDEGVYCHKNVEIAELQERLEQSRSHVAEMNACINHAFHIASAKPQDYAIMLALGDKASGAWLLRKEANAVEAFAEWADPHWPKSQAVMIKDDAKSYAYELRQKAETAEKGCDDA